MNTPKPRLHFDCSRCPGYCCSHARIAVSDFDIARLARHFGVSPAEAKHRFTYHYQTGDADEQILRHQRDHIYQSVCRFFDTEERRCTIYEARPNVCRKYPYGSRCGYYDFLKFERALQDDDEFIPSA
jgi:Fe-S-cluster containining protein